MSWRIALLTGGSFTVGSSAYLIAGVLPAISGELDVSPSAVGQLVTVFALAYAIASPLLTTAASSWERRRLLLAALGLGVLGNALAAAVPDYSVLVVARIVTALGGAVFMPVAGVVATALVPPERRGRALSIVYGGLALSLILWVPLASVIAGPIGYRGVFLLIAAMALLAGLAIRFGLPAVDAPPAVPLRARVAAVADPRVRLLLVVTTIGSLAAFGVFTYIAPLLARTGGFGAPGVGLALLAYGVGSVVGTAAGGAAADRYGPRGPFIAFFAVFMVMLATLSLTTATLVGAVVALFVWGTVTWAMNPPTQTWLLQLAPSPAAGPLLLSANTSALYLGIGLAGVFGGVVIVATGVTALPLIAAAVGAVGLLLLLIAVRKDAPAAARPATGPA